jgi:hypothetical protein
MVSSSKNCLIPSDISGSLENDELVEKLAYSNDRELLDTDENSESDFCYEEYDVWLPDSGDDNDGEMTLIFCGRIWMITVD